MFDYRAFAVENMRREFGGGMMTLHVRTSEFEITEAMIQFGGSFVQLLARCIRAADQSNKRKLVEAFPEYLKEYDDMAVQLIQKNGAVGSLIDPRD